MLGVEFRALVCRICKYKNSTLVVVREIIRKNDNFSELSLPRYILKNNFGLVSCCHNDISIVSCEYAAVRILTNFSNLLRPKVALITDFYCRAPSY